MVHVMSIVVSDFVGHGRLDVGTFDFVSLQGLGTVEVLVLFTAFVLAGHIRMDDNGVRFAGRACGADEGNSLVCAGLRINDNASRVCDANLACMMLFKDGDATSPASVTGKLFPGLFECYPCRPSLCCTVIRAFCKEVS